MAKHGNTHYIELDRGIFTKQHESMPYHAKWLFTVLSELEHRFSGKNEDFFFRSGEDLSKDSGMSIKTIRKYRKVLEEAGLIKTWKMHWLINGKKSEKHVTAFRITR